MKLDTVLFILCYLTVGSFTCNKLWFYTQYHILCLITIVQYCLCNELYLLCILYNFLCLHVCPAIKIFYSVDNILSEGHKNNIKIYFYYRSMNFYAQNIIGKALRLCLFLTVQVLLLKNFLVFYIVRFA